MTRKGDSIIFSLYIFSFFFIKTVKKRRGRKLSKGHSNTRWNVPELLQKSVISMQNLNMFVDKNCFEC